MVHTPIDPMSYHGPTPSIRRRSRVKAEADLLPGGFRKWPEMV